MKEQPTGKASAKGGATDWKRLRTLSDKGIRIAVKADPEARPTDVDFWKQAKIVMPRAKLVWLRPQKGYQTPINAVYEPAWKRRSHDGPNLDTGHGVADTCAISQAPGWKERYRACVFLASSRLLRVSSASSASSR